MHLNLKKSMALVVLAAGAASASAADVSVTASFSDLTIGTYGTIYGSYNTIQVDGVNNVLCAGVDEPNGCRTLRLDSQNPTRSYATAGGASVHFGFGNVFSPENVFSFTGATSNVLGTGPANTFKLGTFTYTNGSFYDLSYLDFKLTTNSS